MHQNGNGRKNGMARAYDGKLILEAIDDLHGLVHLGRADLDDLK